MIKIIDEYGTIIGELEEGDRILRKSSSDKLIGTELFDNGDFIKLFTCNLFDVADELTGTESMLMMRLASFIQYTSGVLTHPNGKCLTRNCIMELIGKSESVVDKLVSSLVSKKILGKHRTGKNEVCFTVNPYIFMRGNRVNKTLRKLFENSKWAKNEPKKGKWKGNRYGK